MRRHFWVSSLLALYTSFASPSWAQSSRADELFAEGRAAYDAGRYQDALKAYLGAWDLKKTFDIAGNLAQTELKLAKTRDAVEHLAFVLESFPVTGKPELRARIEQDFKEARAQVAELKITTSVEGASVTVDGRAVGKTPLQAPVFVDAGPRTVEARLAGFDVSTKTVQAAKGGTVDVALELVPQKGSPAGPGPGPGPGPVPPVPPPSSGPNIPIVLGGTVLAVVGVGLGIGFTVASGRKASDADDKLASLRASGGGCQAQPQLCDEIDADRGSRDALANGAVIGFVSGGVLAGATLAYAVLSRTPAAATGVRLVPIVSAGAGQVRVVGSW